jgi:excisionase family DNA binding protein
VTVRTSEERMVSTEEVAKWLGIATRTVCTWAECNELPGMKVGRQWRFRRSAIAEWLEKPNRLQNGDATASASRERLNQGYDPPKIAS